MPTNRQLFTGNSFLTTVHFPDEPEWTPLQHLARVVWQTPQLPQFHPYEFMYMAAVRGGRPKVTIHLYKHIDTRHYLNLDDAGHAYAYQHRFGDPQTSDSGGRYRRYRDMSDAIDVLELHAFDDDPPLFRSYPPQEWAS